jgi:predicted metal-dependent hydrolase
MRRLTLKTPHGPLQYTVGHRARVTKRLHMELDEHGDLLVIAPGHWSKRHINATLMQNTSRVQRFIANAKQRQVPPLRYCHGEEHLYLGGRYRLLVSQTESGKKRVELNDDEIVVHGSVLNQEKVQAQLHDWYQRQAMALFSERLQQISAKTSWASDRDIPLKLRRMKRTWGNCSSKGVIKLNTHLIKAPLAVIDSVIAHELCHLEEMNHGKGFYRLLEQLNPNWHQDRARLRTEGFSYLLT